MSDRKHYVNPKEPGQLCFVTATCLDFAHLFARPEMRTRMALSLLQDCKTQHALLRAFVIMKHHIHLVVKPAENRTISHLMSEIKRNSESRLSPQLLDLERAQLNMQIGLGRNKFWKRSFRANPLYTEEVYLQKIVYLHNNPIRSGYVEYAEDYPWSSLPLLQSGMMQEDRSIELESAINHFKKVLTSGKF